MYRLSIDSGGTFTDFTVADDSGALTKAKVPSSRDVRAFMSRGLQALSAELGLPPADFLAQVGLLIHGTTVPLNALLQARGPVMGLLCTEGFRDTLELRLGYREARYDLTAEPPPPLVPRHLRAVVRERIDRNGEIVIPLHPEDVDGAAEVFERHGVGAVAVCLLWSFLNPVHERRVRELLAERLPGMPVWLSSEVCPEIREYERTSTTVVNGYVAEALAVHQDRLEAYLQAEGFRGEIRYLQSNGGLAGGRTLRAQPVAALLSGPAAGPAAGLVFTERLGHRNAIVVDMGGTSFDACLVTNGVAETRNVFTVGGHRVRSPAIGVETIGAGGGSIATVDRGLLSVGPGSAGADPGPACYDQGGNAATVTDANLLLGFINPDALLGGTLTLRPECAAEAVQRHVADPLGISVARAALGVFEVVNQNMADALRAMTLGIGRDPRDYVLVAGGGAGPVHAGVLARMVGIDRVIVPRVAAELCAFGGLVGNLRHDYRRSCTSRIEHLEPGRLRRLLQEMEEEGRQELAREGAPPENVVVTRVLDMRYKDQTYETPVDVTDIDLDEQAIPALLTRFHQVYFDLYQYSQRGQACEIINARVTVLANTPAVALKPTAAAAAPLSAITAGSRLMRLPDSGEAVEVPVYAAGSLGAGHVLHGPAIVEEPDTTIVIFPGWRLDVTAEPAYLMTDLIDLADLTDRAATDRGDET